MKIIMAIAFSIITVGCLAQVKIGQQAPEISLPDTKGNILSLSSLKGKVVLLDFWASWCVPCRKSIPQVVKLYEKYKHRGFEVVGISIDSKQSQWLKAIQQLKMSYLQVNDAKGWEAASALAYGVDAIPATFLLNKEGIIVAIDPAEKNLEEQVHLLLQ